MKEQIHKLGNTKNQKPTNRITLKVDFAKAYGKYAKIPQRHEKVKLYKKVMPELLQELFNELVFNCMEWKLPYKLGYLNLIKYKANPNKRSIDWKTTKETNKRRATEGKKPMVIFNRNYFTDGFDYTFKWIKEGKHYCFKNKKFYRFELVRSLKRALVEPIRNREICNKV